MCELCGGPAKSVVIRRLRVHVSVRHSLFVIIIAALLLTLVRLARTRHVERAACSSDEFFGAAVLCTTVAVRATATLCLYIA